MLPPKPGSLVWVYGWPQQKIKIEGNDHQWNVELRVEPGWVEEIIYPMQAHRMGDFPCLRIRTNFENGLPHGMSGGPVLYNGRLVGIFTGPDLVASLWPLALMTYPISKEENAPEDSFSQHFDSSFIDASYDWDTVKGRPTRVPCREAVTGKDIEPCERMHAVLLPAHSP